MAKGKYGVVYDPQNKGVGFFSQQKDGRFTPHWEWSETPGILTEEELLSSDLQIRVLREEGNLGLCPYCQGVTFILASFKEEAWPITIMKGLIGECNELEVTCVTCGFTHAIFVGSD